MIVALGQWFLDEMERLEDLTRVFKHDAHRLVSLTAVVKTNLVDLSYRSAATLLRAVRPDVEDPEALAVIVLGSLVAVRRTAWTYRSSPLEIDDDRVLSTWTPTRSQYSSRPDLRAAAQGGTDRPSRT